MLVALINVFKKQIKLGFTRMFIPKNNIGGWTFPKDVEIVGVSTVADTIRKALGDK